MGLLAPHRGKPANPESRDADGSRQPDTRADPAPQHPQPLPEDQLLQQQGCPQYHRRVDDAHPDQVGNRRDSPRRSAHWGAPRGLRHAGQVSARRGATILTPTTGAEPSPGRSSTDDYSVPSAAGGGLYRRHPRSWPRRRPELPLGRGASVRRSGFRLRAGAWARPVRKSISPAKYTSWSSYRARWLPWGQ